MDFDYKKISHIFALLVLLFSFFLLIIIPILTFFGFFSTVDGEINITEIAVLIGSVITIIIFIGTPFIWYLLVNEFKIKQMFKTVKLTINRIDEAFLWGIVAAVLMFIIIIAIGFFLYALGIVDQDAEISNVDDIASNLSIFSMVFIIVFQSIGEEVFFRGFLLDKIGSLTGKNIAILITAILFGLAHMSYGKIYPVIMPIIMGILLGYIVFKTKNLFAAITAHMLFNFGSFILYLFAQSL